ncbi:MAG: SGNH/GDSL hydrolase family protein [Verrucomicrobiales bacterium]
MESSQSSPYSRRKILQTAATLGALGAAGSQALEAESSEGSLKKGSVILFQGDSITDDGRKMDVLEPNDGKALGNGYAAMAAGELLLAHPDMDLRIYNRGISGHKIPDLAGRWDRDAVALKPDILSILIGVNDLWHTFAFGNKYKATIEDYESGFRALIQRSQKEIPGVRIVICEPFTTRTSKEFEPLAKFRAVSKKLADEMSLTFVPFQALFDEAVKAAPAEFWLWDGIHPSVAGHAIMARKWRETVGI